jgi:LacI family transcriptional regulator
MKDVAAAAGVSPATVSYVMNGRGRISPEAEARVRAAAAELRYEPNRSAHALRTGRSGIIACVVPTMASPIFPEITRAVQTRAAEHGLTTLLVDAGTEPREELEALLLLERQGVDGAVAVLSPAIRESDLPALPLVLLDSPINGWDCVRADHLAGGRLMAEHLIARGHQRIALLWGDGRLFSSRVRREGFIAASGRLKIVADFVVPLAPVLPKLVAATLAGTEATAVACVNDVVAIGALGALKAGRRQVPQDVAVIGFDDMDMAAWPLLDLTTVRQPIAHLGAAAVDRLLERINCPSDSYRHEVVMPVSLVRRSSA